MKNSAAVATASLLQAHSHIVERLSNGLSAVHGISLSELMILMYLKNSTAEKLSRSELAQCMRISASTITRQIAPLEKRGILLSFKDERDARLTYVALTQAGNQLVNDARKSFMQSSRGFFADLWDEEEVSQFSDYLKRLTVNTPGSLI